jgi:hypothetical protein
MLRLRVVAPTLNHPDTIGASPLSICEQNDCKVGVIVAGGGSSEAKAKCWGATAYA